MAKVLEAVDLDKYMEGASSLCSEVGFCLQPTLLLQCTLLLFTWHHAGAPLEEAVRPGHELPEKVLKALKDDGKV